MPMRRAQAIAIAIATGALAGACVDLQPFVCSDDAQCERGGVQGSCEVVGYCSYPDESCASGRRYGELAANLSGVCTGEATGTATEGEPTTTEGATSPASTSADGGSSTSPGEPSSEDTAAPQPVCGNGVVEEGEECDEPDGVDGDGCNTDCVRSGSMRWSVLVASESGADRLFGLTTLVTGDVVAAGHIQAATRDVLLVRYTVDGEEVGRVVHDVDGAEDEAVSVAQGGTGRLYVCGRSRIGGALRPWMARWDAQLGPDPEYEGELPGVPASYCQDVEYVSSGQIVAVGGDSSAAWAYTFADGNLAGGQQALLEPGGATLFKEVERAPDGSVYVAGQASDLGVVYQPVSATDVGMPLVETVEVVELQSMVVTDDTLVVGGLLRQVAGIDDLWVAAYELDGSERWRFASDLGQIDEIEDVAVDGAGNVYAIGHVVSATNTPDRWVGKLDPAGALVWQRSDYPDSEGDDRGRSIEVIPGGDLVMVAEVIGPGGDLDGFIARLAP